MTRAVAPTPSEVTRHFARLGLHRLVVDRIDPDPVSPGVFRIHVVDQRPLIASLYRCELVREGELPDDPPYNNQLLVGEGMYAPFTLRWSG